MPGLRVISYNIHKGFSAGKRKFILRHLKDAIKSIEIDIVFLQEVLDKHDRLSLRVPDWPISPQSEFLAEGSWEHVAYAPASNNNHGHHGNAILSRYPIESVSSIDLSTNSFEQRSLLHAVINIPGFESPVHCICLHLDLLKRGRAKQVQWVSERIKSFVPPDAPLIVGGDFNDWTAAASRILKKETGVIEAYAAIHGKYAVSYPSKLPLLKLDRIYVRNLRPRFAEVLRGPLWRRLSDHAPILAVVEPEESSSEDHDHE